MKYESGNIDIIESMVAKSPRPNPNINLIFPAKIGYVFMEYEFEVIIPKFVISCRSLLKIFKQDIIVFNYSEQSSMELSSSEESSEDCQLPFWNNWSPSSNEVWNKKDPLSRQNVTKKFPSSFALSSIDLFTKNSKHGNWVPPAKFFNLGVKGKTKPRERNVCHKTLEKSGVEKTVKVPYFEDHKDTVKPQETPWQGNSCRRNEMFGWGGRKQLHDITQFNDGDLIWGVVNLGVFAHIRLWINDYGNICGSADGIISKLGSSETTFISITNPELLRKMLGLTSAQWASLCETVQEAKSVLKFDAFQEFTFIGKTALEKLWFFICKRRHFLPDQCMLVRFNGAVKCLREFKINPKVIVQEIQSIPGQSII